MSATTEDGYYVIPNLPLGTYTVTFKKEGFEAQRYTDVLLNAGTEAVIDAQLKVGAVSTTIDVTGGAPVLETSRVSTGRTISFNEVNNVPLTSRNPYNLIIFQPGMSGHPNPELGIPRTLNTNGLLDRINYQMDGMIDTQTDRYGLRLFPISDIYVREVQTVSNSLRARIRPDRRQHFQRHYQFRYESIPRRGLFHRHARRTPTRARFCCPRIVLPRPSICTTTQ